MRQAGTSTGWGYGRMGIDEKEQREASGIGRTTPFARIEVTLRKAILAASLLYAFVRRNTVRFAVAVAVMLYASALCHGD